MPELPGAETICPILEPQLAERTTVAVHIRNAQAIAHPNASGLAAMAQGRTIQDLSRRGKPVKNGLLDQTVVAGIGNIYADQVLWEARMRPHRTCSGLSTCARNKVAAAIHQVVQWGIKAYRVTPEEYLGGAGREYRSIPDLRAYGRADESCRRCGAPVRRVTIGNRSSYHCPRRQRKA